MVKTVRFSIVLLWQRMALFVLYASAYQNIFFTDVTVINNNLIMNVSSRGVLIYRL